MTYEKQSSDHQQNYRIIPISLEVVVSQYLVVDLGVQNQQQEERDDTKKYKPSVRIFSIYFYSFKSRKWGLRLAFGNEFEIHFQLNIIMVNV